MKLTLNIILLFAFTACFLSLKVSAQDYNDTVIVEDPVQYNETHDGEYTTTGEHGTDNESSHKYERLYMDEYKLEALRRKKEFQYPDMDSVAAKDTLFIRPDQNAVPERNRFKGFDASILMWLI